jgi:hypothetical protein
MIDAAWKQPVWAAALAGWLVVPAAAQAPAGSDLETVIDNPQGCPVEIVAASVSPITADTGFGQLSYAVSVRNLSRKKVVRFDLSWTLRTDSGATVRTETFGYLLRDALKRGRTLRQDRAERWSGPAVDSFEVTTALVKFADQSSWTSAEPPSLRDRAENGDPKAQYRLGLSYRDGRGVPRDPISAYVWLNLSSIFGQTDAAATRDELAATMSPEQIDEAQRLSRDWGLFYFMRLLE